MPRYDVRVAITLEGKSQLDIVDQDADVNLKGTVDIIADASVHLVFGVDGDGFYIDPGAPKNSTGSPEPELSIGNIRLGEEIDAGGLLGFFTATITDATVSMNPGVAVTVDLVEPGADPFTATTDGMIRTYELFPFDFDLVSTSIQDNPSADDVTLSATVGVSAVDLPEDGLSILPDAHVTLTWPDIMDPTNFNLAIAEDTDAGQLLSDLFDMDMRDLILPLLQEMDGVGDDVLAISALDSDLPYIDVSVNDLLTTAEATGVGDALKLHDAVDAFLADADTYNEQPAFMEILDVVIPETSREVSGSVFDGTLSRENGRTLVTFDVVTDISLESEHEADVNGTAVNLPVVADLKLDFSFGLDLTDLLSGGTFDASDAFFVLRSLSTKATLDLSEINRTGDLQEFPFALENATVKLVRGADVTVKDTSPAVNGRIFFADLSSGSFSSLFDVVQFGEQPDPDMTVSKDDGITIDDSIVIKGNTRFEAKNGDITIGEAGGFITGDDDGNPETLTIRAGGEITIIGEVGGGGLQEIVIEEGEPSDLEKADVQEGLLTGLDHMATLGSNVGGGDALNTPLPIVKSSPVMLGSLVDIEALLSLYDTVDQYFTDPDPDTPEIETPTYEGLAQAITDKILEELGPDAQGSVGGGPVTVNGGYYEDTNELRFDIGLNYSQEFDFDFDLGSDFSNLGLTIDDSLTVKLTLHVKFDISFGLDMNNMLNGLGLNPAQDLFIKVGEARFGAVLAFDNMNFEILADIGGATGTLEVVDGMISMDASLDIGFNDADGDGKLRLSQLSSLLSLITFTPSGILGVHLPIYGSLTGPTFSTEGAMLLSVKPFDVFSGKAPKFLLALEGSVNFSGFFYANGSFAIQTFDPQTVALNDGTQMDVSLVTIGAQDIYGFAGVNGPYFTPADDLNGNGMVDPDENTNESSTGFAISGVEFAAAFMKTLPPEPPPPPDPPPPIPDPPPIQTDFRSWTALRARVGDVRPVGLPDGITIAAQDLFVGINQGGGTNNGVANTTVVDLAATPLDVRTGVDETDVITLNFAGSKGELIEAGGSVILDVRGFFFVSGTMAFGKMSSTVTLYDTVTKTSTPGVKLNLFTVGAVGVDAFAGVNGPYWTDLDGSETVNWTDAEGNVLDPAVADLNHDGVVDANETAELNENTIGLSLIDVNFGLAMMSTPPPAPLDPPPAIADNRTWTTLKAEVGSAEFVGVEGLTVRAESLMVAVSLGGGAVGTALNNTVVDFASTPIEVNPSSDPNDKITFDYSGTAGALIEAHGRVVLDLFGFFCVSGNFAFLKKTEMVRLYNTETGLLDEVDTEVDLLTVGLSKVNAFAGVNGPYWTDRDGSGDLSWTDKDGNTLDQATADLNHNGVIDAAETTELEEAAVGLALSNVNVALAMMSPRAPPAPPPPPPASTDTFAKVTVVSPGPDNDLTFTATTAGTAFNNVTVEYTNGAAPHAAYDSAAKKLTITVVPGVTTAANIITQLQTDAVTQFTAAATVAEPLSIGAINTAAASTDATGVKTVVAPGDQNDLTFTGPSNVEISYVHGDAVGAVYDGTPGVEKLTITIVPGFTTAAEVIAALGSVNEFSAAAAEADPNGVINTASASTGLTGNSPHDGEFAHVKISNTGSYNDLIFTAATAGAVFNDTTVEYVDGAALDAVYDSLQKKLTITIQSGVTRAAEIITRLETVSEFSARAAEGSATGVVNTASGSTGSTGSDANVARVIVKSPGEKNDLKITATAPGSDYSNVTVEYVNGTVAGAVYDNLTKVLTVTVVPGVTTISAKLF